MWQQVIVRQRVVVKQIRHWETVKKSLWVRQDVSCRVSSTVLLLSLFCRTLTVIYGEWDKTVNGATNWPWKQLLMHLGWQCTPSHQIRRCASNHALTLTVLEEHASSTHLSWLVVPSPVPLPPLMPLPLLSSHLQLSCVLVRDGTLGIKRTKELQTKHPDLKPAPGRRRHGKPCSFLTSSPSIITLWFPTHQPIAMRQQVKQKMCRVNCLTRTYVISLYLVRLRVELRIERERKCCSLINPLLVITGSEIAVFA